MDTGRAGQKQADAVLYDALVNTDLLNLVPAAAPRIYVGKRAGNHEYTQAEINQLIVDYACQYGHIVRLKAGAGLYYPVFFGIMN